MEGIAASILQKSLSTSRMVAGGLTQSAGVQELQSPVQSAPHAPSATKPKATPAPDSVRISPEARALAQAAEQEHAGEEENSLQLSPEEKDQVREMQSRDTEVRAHEHAHASAGGAAAGSPSFTFEQGPDGRQYAVGGEVSISVQSGSTPEETLRNAAQVRAAALAPSEPSSADRGVAAAATSMEMQARQEMAEARVEQEKQNGTDGVTPSSSLAIDDSETDGGSAFAVEEGGSFDPRTRAYTSAPAASAEPALLDLFG